MWEFHTRLKAIREDSDRTQLEVAEALNITRTALTNYESGYREPNISLLVKIADYFDVSLDYLLCRTNLRISFSKACSQKFKNK
ncbi:helix-turn-helix domain-containing protein [Clostridium brassicae]|uniref:Helix-turn-helix transcriptional regulator n=1 Tax=Clostridium brassicae TaxID=2999072 RepID=A0ABT4D720_9CLOT|nr:helix-turn-helix transcriptional regulator [Clostridium brassicae]MCY6957983.1 helix-turn-helix transcriptional regulator [Clostridium brassicae]